MKRKKPEIIVNEWTGCYPSSWKGMIVPEAMSHPAKFSSRLIRNIYEHMINEGWLKPGDVVIDPFGGVALGALDAMRLGMRWRGVELEKRFVELGQANISFWRQKYSRLPHWSNDAALIQGDSRKLLEILVADHFEEVVHPESQAETEVNGYTQGVMQSPPYSNVEITGKSNFQSRFNPTGKKAGNLRKDDKGYKISLSSPPYADGCRHTGGDTPTSEEHMEGGELILPGIKGVISSSPYAEARIGKESGQESCGRGDQYGETKGQLGAMEASPDAFHAMVTSPPYSAEGLGHKGKGNEFDEKHHLHARMAGNSYGKNVGQLGEMKSNDFDAAISSPPFRQASGGTPEPKPGGTIDKALYQRHLAGNSAAKGYGDTTGNLANMDDQSFEGAVSSPPFRNETKGTPLDPDKYPTLRGVLKDNAGNLQNMGESPENLSNMENDFWFAAKAIVEQVFISLVPGGHAVWVCKDFVKNKQIAPFCDQWRQLCEAVGFVTLHEHHAMLVRHKGTSITLEGGTVEHKTESKSFFRRLAESKGSPRIDYEVVFCMIKP